MKALSSAPKKHLIEGKIEVYSSYYKHPSYYLERKLIHALQKANRSEAELTMQAINKIERAQLADTPLRSLKNSLIASCTLFTRAAISANIPPQEAFCHSDAHIRTIENIQQFAALQAYEYEMLSAFLDLIETYRYSNYADLTVQMISYIHEHIAEKITVDQLSKNLQKSKNYLSTVFNHDVGMSVSGYVNYHKVEESKYFIQYSNFSISEVAEIFHFCNVAYYTNTFLKYTGLTPKEFRRNYEQA